MKVLRLLFALPVALLFFTISGTTLTSCTKNGTDTVYITHDSIIYVHDTTNVNDTVYDITSGLVAYYNFNNGNLNDSSGNNNNIIFNNATPTKDRNGVSNNAYLFDGASSYMEIANSQSLNPDNITLYAIFKVNGFYYGTDHANFILMKDWDQANGMYILQYTDFVISYGLPDTLHEIFQGGYGDNNNTSSSTGVKSTGSYVQKGVWYKMAYTYDGIVGKTYINGTLVGSVVNTASFTPNTADLHIGRNEDPYGLFPFWFNGVIDEVRIYNRALSPKAIAQLTDQP